ncbi:MAG TPA: hypothetical protein VGG19_19970 [Tepidisphaeraceae bacterium]|jgi:hypothetical protein
MKKKCWAAVALCLLVAGSVKAEQISFLSSDSFAGVNGDTSGWSTDGNVVNTGEQSYSLLGGKATVSAYQDGATTYSLDGSTQNVLISQTGTRGLGVWDDPNSSIPVEGDEIDNFGGHETIEIDFTSDYAINYVEVRSLFDSTTTNPNTNYVGQPTPPEQAMIEFYNGSTLVKTQFLTGKDLLGIGDGEQDVTYTTPVIADRIVFAVPTSADLGMTYTGMYDPYIFTDYALARLDVTPTVPLPPAAIAALPLGALVMIRKAMKRHSLDSEVIA